MPSLGGLTARQAAQDERRRPELEVLLREIEQREMESPGPQRYDVMRVRAILGM